jgi:small subunit ribosomal protein S7
MPRRGRIIKREIPAESRYGSQTVAKVIRKVMQNGKKSTAEQIVYGALQIAAERMKKEPVDLLEQAIKNSAPLLEVKPRRVAGATYRVPVEVRPDRSTALAIRWLIAAARARTGKSMAEKLADEITDAAQGQGATIKKREELHKMAESNRAFVHFRW